MDSVNTQVSPELIGGIQERKSNKKFFCITGIVLIIGLLLAIILPTGLHTGLSQNLIKTTGITYVGLSIAYSFICLYRFLSRKKLVRTLKEILLTTSFLLWLYNFSTLIDWALLATNRDLEPEPSNIIAFALIALFIIFQTLFLRKDTH